MRVATIQCLPLDEDDLVEEAGGGPPAGWGEFRRQNADNLRGAHADTDLVVVLGWEPDIRIMERDVALPAGWGGAATTLRGFHLADPQIPGSGDGRMLVRFRLSVWKRAPGPPTKEIIGGRVARLRLPLINGQGVSLDLCIHQDAGQADAGKPRADPSLVKTPVQWPVETARLDNGQLLVLRALPNTPPSLKWSHGELRRTQEVAAGSFMQQWWQW